MSDTLSEILLGVFFHVKGVITINNPYTGILKILQSGLKTTPTLCLGTVAQSSPLQIKTGELELDQEDLLLSTTVTNLNRGDILLLYPTSNNQSYIAICKVVKP